MSNHRASTGPSRAAEAEAEIDRLKAEVRSLEERLGEAELSEREHAEITARSNAVLEAAADGIISIDDRGTVEFVNPAGCRLFGYESDEVLGHNVKMLMPAPFSAEHDTYLENYLRTGKKKIIGIGREVAGLRKDGSVFPMELAVAEAHTGDRKVFSGIVRDISDRRRMEDDRSNLGRILEESRNEIYVFDDTTLHFRLVNRGARDNLGFSIDELREMTPVDIKPEFSEDEFRESLRAVLSGESDSVNFRTVHQRKDGTEYRVDIRLQHSRDRGEFVATVLDITEQEVLERQLLQAQKMEAVGTLAGGVAHDFNNLLTSIQGSGELILQQVEPGSSAARSAERIGKAAERGEALTKQLLAFSRKQVTRPECLDLNEAVLNAAQLFGRMIGEDITLEWSLESGLKSIEFDPAQFDQVVINLVVNARDAMSKGGCLSISTGRENLDEDRARGLEIPPGEYDWLAFCDTGSGIAPDVLANLFDPFFTTKPAGKGTGLGLSTVLGIMRQHCGAIGVKSEEGHGATFTLYFLPSEGESIEREPSRASTALLPVNRQYEVLVVEDDELLRDLMVEVLEAGGFAVVAAEGPPAALALADKHDGPFDLVITDVVMPQISGFELATKLRAQMPGVVVLYMSGYTDQVLADRGELADDDAFLRKPFGNDELLKKVRELLEENPI